MENHGDVDKAGGECHNTIKKFLTTIKDDSCISMSNSRCRELDCLRAYYYLAILDFLRDSFQCSQLENDSVDGMPSTSVPFIGQTAAPVCALENESLEKTVKSNNTITQLDRKMGEKPKLMHNANEAGADHFKDVGDLDQNGKLNCSDSTKVLLVSGKLNDARDTASMLNSISSSFGKNKDQFNGNKASTQKPGLISPISPSSPTALLPPVQKLSKILPESSSVDSPLMPSGAPLMTVSSARKADISENISQGYTETSAYSYSGENSFSCSKAFDFSGNTSKSANKSNSEKNALRVLSGVPKGQLNYTSLLRLSKGILWDIQAKKEALIETLGYIHRAISQQLLTHRSVVDNDHNDTNTQDPNFVNLSNEAIFQTTDGTLEDDGNCHQTRLIQSTPHELKIFSENSKQSTNMPSSSTCENGIGSLELPSTERSPALSSQSIFQMNELSRRDPHRHFLESQTSCRTSGPLPIMEYDVSIQNEQEMFGTFASEPMAAQKSRKVLWMDGKKSDSELSPWSSKSAFHVSKKKPDRSSIPVEWDDLPVDVKYTQPYITLALLQQEQEKISQELKRMPDISQVPFPAAHSSICRLLDTTLNSPHLLKSEKLSYFKQLNDWALLFAVTIHQQNETQVLFSRAASECFADS